MVLSSVDSVARPTIQNIHQFNGVSGCSFCLHEGEVIEIGAGHTRVYPGTTEKESRSLKQHFEDCKQSVIQGVPVNGVKGPSILSNIPTFDITQSFSTDYLHNILLGVVKTFAESWFNSTNSEKQWYIGRPADIEKFDSQLLQIKPPCEITRTPRSIRERNLYKASEWKNFLLYYSLPCLQNSKFPKEFLSHWCLLIRGIYIFLKPFVAERDIVNGEKLLKKFVADVDKLYGKELYKFNVHLILHIAECVRKFGPLWAPSTFCYEHYNGVLKKMFHNSRGIPQQICKCFLQHKQTEDMACKIFADSRCPNDLKILIDTFFYDFKAHYVSSSTTAGAGIEEFRCVGPAKKGRNISESFLLAIGNLVQEDLAIQGEEFYASCTVRGMTVHALDEMPLSMRRRINSYVKLIDDRIVAVKKIVRIADGRIFLEIENYKHLPQPTSSLPHKLGKIVTVTEKQSCSVVAITPDLIKQKCIAIECDATLFITPLVNSLERD